MFMTPGLPFVPAIAVTVNIYLIFKLSILTLVRFTVWMILGTKKKIFFALLKYKISYKLFRCKIIYEERHELFVDFILILRMF